jgi:hypothetical protein
MPCWKPRKPTRNELKLATKNRDLTVQLLRMREQLEIAQRHRTGLEALLDVRGEKIDKLTVQIDQLRAQNRRLDEEANHMAERIRLAPQLNAAAAAAK